MKSELRDESISRVFDNLRKIVQVLYAHSRRLERSVELTPPQSWLVTVLDKSQPTSVSELAREMHLNPATVIRILNRLETRGLVVRTSPAEDDRLVRMALTHRGRKLAEKMPAIPQGVILTGLREIPEDRLQVISEGLELLVKILDVPKKAPFLFFSPVSNAPENPHARRG